jgi:hypothetical protein
MVTADGVNALLALAPTAWLVGKTVGFAPGQVLRIFCGSSEIAWPIRPSAARFPPVPRAWARAQAMR